MVIEEILGGLKNAIERGESPQKAAATFINAGYSSEEVNGALKRFSGVSLKKENSLGVPSIKSTLSSLSNLDAPTPKSLGGGLQPLPRINVKNKSQSKSKLIIVGAIIAVLAMMGVLVAMGLPYLQDILS